MLPLLLPLLSLARAHWRPLAGAVALVLAFLAGRFSAPVKTTTRDVERVVYKDRVVTQRVEVQGETKTQERVVFRDRTVVTHADGTVEHRDVVRTDVEHGDAVVRSDVLTSTRTHEEAKATEHEKTIDFARPSWQVNALGAVQIGDLSKPFFGVQVERRIGPLWVGAFGLSDGTAGVSLGIQF